MKKEFNKVGDDKPQEKPKPDTDPNVPVWPPYPIPPWPPKPHNPNPVVPLISPHPIPKI